MHKQKLFHLLVGFFLVTLSQLMGQEVGTLTGTVTNAAGAAVPQANITIKSNSTGFSQSVITDASGNFTVSNLPHGVYTVTVEVSGYKRLSQENVQIMAGQPVKLTLGVQAGSANETVEVAGDAPMVQDQNGQISQGYNSRIISQLPLQYRNPQQLVGLMSGVTPPAPGVASGTPSSATMSSSTTAQVEVVEDPQGPIVWNTNGQPAQANRQLLNGTENDELALGIAVHNPTLDSVQQVNVITGDYDASQGRAGGTILNYVTNRGTNGLHGSLFAFNDNAWFNARNYFNPIGFPQDRYNSNLFGGSVGGRIVRDHIFFFGSWESDYLRSDQAMAATVPTAAMLAGNFSAIPGATIYNPASGPASGTARAQFPGNIIPASLISPVSSRLLGYFPAPNEPGITNNYLTSVPFRNDNLRFEGRIDDRFNDRTGMYLSYSYGNGFASQNSVLPIIGTSLDSHLRDDHASIGITHSFGSSTTTDLRFSYSRYNDNIYPTGTYLSAAAAGFTYSNGSPISGPIPSISIPDLPAIGANPSYPQTNIDQSLNLSNSWSKRWRGHDLRFGVDLWGVRLDGFQNLPYGPSGSFVFGSGATSLNNGVALGGYSSYANSFASFLLGAPTQSGVGLNVVTPSNYTTEMSGYIADTFQATHHLTLDIGLRYELFSPLQPRNAAGNFIYDLPSNMLLPIGQGFVNGRGNVRWDTDDWAPRFGFAYRMGEKTVVRGGYGISYWNGTAQFGNEFVNANSGLEQGVNGSYNVAGSFSQVPFPPVISGATVARNATYYVVPRNIQTPYVQSFNFSIQRDLGWATVLDVSFVGALGRELPFVQNVNAAAPGTGTAGLPFNVPAYGNRTSPIYLESTGANSNYNALQFNLTKRFSKNLGMTLAYTWSKSLDNTNGLTPLQDNYNTTNNYGLSNFDRTNVLTISHVWQLPFGAGTNHLSSGVLGHILGPWQIDGVFTYASGTPWTPTADAGLCACPGNTVRAEVVPNGYSTVIGYYPTFFGFYPFAYNVQNYALAQPAAGSYGDVARNALRGSGITNYNMSVFRSFVMREGMRLEVRGEAYNLANSSFFANPSVTNVNAGNFGQSTSLLPGFSQRTIQLALRLVF